MSDKRDNPPPPPTERTIIRPARAAPPAGGAPAHYPPPPPPMGAAPPPPPSPAAPGGAERTIIAPAGGGGAIPPATLGFGAPPPSYAAAPPRQQGNAAPARLDFADEEPPIFGPEPLVAAASRLIHLSSRLRTMAVGPDLAALRQLVIRELEAFGRRATTLGLEPRSAQLAHYILCAFVDDAVMSTPWGANSPWSQHSLLAAYHNDVQGGDRLFQFAERMEQDPQREPRLMELLYLCLSLGFEGRAALDPRGASLLSQRRSRLATAIASLRGAKAEDLSPQWRGVERAGGRYRPRVPLWVIVAGLALVGLIIFAALMFRLSSEGSAAMTALDQTVGTTIKPPPPPAPETATPTFDKVRSILAPDVDAGRLAVLREGNDIVLRLVNQGLFDSGSAEPSGAWRDTFGRLAEAANLTRGQIRIEGHTDNQQIRSLAIPVQPRSLGGAGVGRWGARCAAKRRADRLVDRVKHRPAYGDAQPIADNGDARRAAAEPAGGNPRRQRCGVAVSGGRHR